MSTLTWILIALVLVLLLVVYVLIRFRPRKKDSNPYYRGEKRQQRSGRRPFLVLLMLLMIVVALVVLWKMEENQPPTPDGDGILHVVANVVADSQVILAGETVIITVHLDTTEMAGVTYMDNYDELSVAINHYKTKNCEFQLVDDFALEGTYRTVVQILKSAGAYSPDIERKIEF